MGTRGTCKVDGCEKDVRGKGYCDRHYRAWRKGKLGKARYRSCNTGGCSRPATRRGLCSEHFASAYAKAKAAEAASEASA
jgi:hypothetical protein